MAANSIVRVMDHQYITYIAICDIAGTYTEVHCCIGAALLSPQLLLQQAPYRITNTNSLHW